MGLLALSPRLVENDRQDRTYFRERVVEYCDHDKRLNPQPEVESLKNSYLRELFFSNRVMSNALFM